MPFINTITNVKITDENREQLKAALGRDLAHLGKSENWLMLSFDDEKKMYFQGSDSAPIAFVDVSVFGKSTDDGCAAMTKAICKSFGDVLGIAADKIYVKYSGTTQWGWNNMNF